MNQQQQPETKQLEQASSSEQLELGQIQEAQSQYEQTPMATNYKHGNPKEFMGALGFQQQNPVDAINIKESKKVSKVTSGFSSNRLQVRHRRIYKPEHEDQGTRNGSNGRSIDQMTAGYSNVSRVENLAIGIQDQEATGDDKLQEFDNSMSEGNSPKDEGDYEEISEHRLADSPSVPNEPSRTKFSKQNPKAKSTMLTEEIRQNQNPGDYASTGDNLSLTKSNSALARIRFNENHSLTSQPASAVFREGRQTTKEEEQQVGQSKRSAQMTLGLKKTLAKNYSDQGTSLEGTPGTDSAEKSGASDGRRSRERKERKSGNSRGGKIPDLKAMINRFKMQNKQLAGPKKVGQSNKKNSSLRIRGAHDSSGSLSGTGQDSLPARNTLDRHQSQPLATELARAQAEEEKMQMSGLTLKQFNAISKTINILQKSKHLRDRGRNGLNNSGLPEVSGYSHGMSRELEMNEEEEEYLQMDIQGLVEKEIEVVQTENQVQQSKTMLAERVQITERFLVYYNAYWRVRWDLLIILLALWNCISIPLEVAFPQMRFFSSLAYIVFGRIVDVLFGVDILVNLRSTYIDEKTGIEVVTGKQIAKNYIFGRHGNDSGEVIGNEKVSRWARFNIFGGRFWIDLMASIPFDLLLASAETEDAESGTTVALLGLLKLVRLLRLGRIVTFMKMRQGLKLGFKIVQMLTVLLLIVHWTGCIIYGFVSERGSWLPPKDLNNQETTFYEQENDLQYPVMFYYGLMLIVGNEMAPKTTAQTILFLAIIIVGSLVMAFIFGSIAAAMSSMGKQQNRFQDLVDIVQTTMIQIQLPEEFQEKIQDYLINVEESQDVNLDFDKFIDLLSPFLKHKVQTYVLKRIISQNAIMSTAKPLAVNFIVQNLKNQILLPQDEIISQETQGEHMYFIIKGILAVYIEKSVQLDTIRAIPGYEKFVPYQLKNVVRNTRRKSLQLGKSRSSMASPLAQSKRKPLLIQAPQSAPDEKKLTSFQITPLSPGQIREQNESGTAGLQMWNVDQQENSSNLATPVKVKAEATRHRGVSADSQGGLSPADDKALGGKPSRLASLRNSAAGGKLAKLSMIFRPSEVKAGTQKTAARSFASPAAKSVGGNVFESSESHKSSASETDADPFDYGLPYGVTTVDFEDQQYVNKKIRNLSDGQHFGEIGLLTRMKRTASVRAKDYSTISAFSRKALEELGDIFPDLVLQFKSNIKTQYKDIDFKFKKLCVKNVPYFSRLKDDLILEIVFMMKSLKFDVGSKIIKRGDNVHRLYFVIEGVVEVNVPFLDRNLHFDFLNPGSNFCVFTCFNDATVSVVNCTAKTSTCINYIEVDDLVRLSKKFIDLKDVLKKIVIEQNKLSKTDFDFFRFCERRYTTPQERALDKLFESNVNRGDSKRKIRTALMRFINNYRQGKAEIPLALEAMQYLQQQKKERAIFSWMQNKEHEHILAFIKRVGSYHIKHGKQLSLEGNYQYLMDQIHKDEDFKMLTIEELEDLEIDFYTEEQAGGSESAESQAHFKDASRRDSCQGKTGILKIEEELAEQAAKLEILTSAIRLDDQAEQPEAYGQLVAGTLGQPRPETPQERADKITGCRLSIANLECQLSLAKIRHMQSQVNEVNLCVTQQMDQIFDIRKKSKNDNEYATRKLQILWGQVGEVRRTLKRMADRGSVSNADEHNTTMTIDNQGAEEVSPPKPSQGSADSDSLEGELKDWESQEKEGVWQRQDE